LSGNPGQVKQSDISQAVSRGRQRVKIEELKQVTEIYCDPRNRQAPAVMVKEDMGYKTRETTSNRIRAARDIGLIPESKDSSDLNLDFAYYAVRASFDLTTAQHREVARLDGDDKTIRLIEIFKSIENNPEAHIEALNDDIKAEIAASIREERKNG
jgi:hypothetical protein